MRKIFAIAAAVSLASAAFATPTASESLAMLKEGNARFVSDDMKNPRCTADRRVLAANSDQGKFAYATILSCADSRVPVEHIFDAGIMDLFVVRVAGNVADNDEIGTIEYGIAHVNTPVVVVLGHSGCGAVKAVTAAVLGKGHALEYNIPGLVDNIEPAVELAMKMHTDIHDEAIVPYAIEENVYQSIRDLFMKSAAARRMALENKIKVVGALYDIGSGKVNWLPDEKVDQILKSTNVNSKRNTQEMAGGGHAESHEAKAAEKEAPAEKKPAESHH